MSWIELHDSARDHPKIKRLARDCSISTAHALGLMCSLWTWALRMSPDGDLSSFENEDIEEAAGWDGDTGLFLKNACKNKLLDVIDNDSFLIHDWPDYAEKLKARVRKRDERERKRTKGPGKIVYFARVDIDKIKIGYSENVIRRMEEHYRDCGVYPIPIGFIHGDHDLEKSIHGKFSHLRIGKTEIFKEYEELKSYIDGHVTRCDDKWNIIDGHVTRYKYTNGVNKQKIGSLVRVTRPEQTNATVTRPEQTNATVTLTDQTDQTDQTERENTRARDNTITENRRVPSLDLPPIVEEEYVHSEYVWQGVIRDWCEISGLPHDAQTNRDAAAAILRLATAVNCRYPQSVVRKALKRWTGDDWVKRNRPPLSNLVKFFDRHISDAPPEATEPPEPSRAACYKRDTKITETKQRSDIERWEREQRELTTEDKAAIEKAQAVISNLAKSKSLENSISENQKLEEFQRKLNELERIKNQ